MDMWARAGKLHGFAFVAVLPAPKAFGLTSFGLGLVARNGTQHHKTISDSTTIAEHTH